MENNFAAKLSSIRRTIHKYPELGNQEYKTSALVGKVLANYGIKITRTTKTGITGVLEGNKTASRKKVIALRADMDALPIREKTNKSYKSRRKGIMHACGHDANTAMVLGAAMLLSKQKNSFPGKVKFIFQPNEETSNGAKDMIKGGALKNPVPGAIIGIHVNPWLSSGVLGLKEGAMMAAVDKFTFEVIGEGGHGAYPNLSKDAVVIMSEIILSLQTIVSREIDPVEPAVISIGSINGGERFNIIADKVTAVGTVRTLNNSARKKIRRLIEKKVKGITSAYGAKYKMSYEELGNPLFNSGNIVEICAKAGEKVLGRKNVFYVEEPSMGGEDFAEYLAVVPGCFIYMGSKGKKAYPWHHESFDIDERVLPKGAAVLAEIAKTYLNK